MIKYEKTAYTSEIEYPELIYNQLHTISSQQTLSIPVTEPNSIIVKVFGEYFTDEFSPVFASSAQYGFQSAYDAAGLYGYQVSMTDSNLNIVNVNNFTKRAYVRIYRYGQ